ncbi:MAG: polymer-forming cytoskeletal protein [Desulfobacterales bacterium]
MAWFKKTPDGEDPMASGMSPLSAKNGTTYLGKNLRVSGSITGRDNVQVFGRHVGDIHLEGDGHLDIMEPAVIRGNLRAAAILVGGTAEGDLIAVSRLEIDRTGVVKGTITTPVIALQEGAVFNGDIKMRD